MLVVGFLFVRVIVKAWAKTSAKTGYGLGWERVSVSITVRARVMSKGTAIDRV